MKPYPSIPRRFQEFKAHVFDKVDGSSLRSEWNKNSGWYKHGKRKGLIDSTNPHLEEAMPEIFNLLLAEPLSKLATDKKWKSLIVFYEFWGEQSVAGLHYTGDTKYLTLFDASIDKKGIIGPKRFRQIFEDVVPTARFLGIHNWTHGFVQRVRDYDGNPDDEILNGITFEGVVGKAGDRHDIVRAKAKTQMWIDKVKEIHGAKAEKILLS